MEMKKYKRYFTQAVAAFDSSHASQPIPTSTCHSGPAGCEQSGNRSHTTAFELNKYSLEDRKIHISCIKEK